MTGAIVLAGGGSRRFGSDKLAVPLADGRSVLAHAVAAAGMVAGELLVVVAPSGSRPDDLPDRAVIVHDPEPDGGPLLGLAAGLEAARDESILLVGGDMPELDPAVLRLLVAAVRDDAGVDAARLEVGESDAGTTVRRGSPVPGSVAVLPCVLRREAALAACRDSLAAGDRRLRGCLERLATSVVPGEAWRAADPTGRTLLDIDRPDDLVGLERLPESG
ncbi:MAG TPA: molybdenum cofactor guanylyltransferase [Candidatus Limnocylindrales bacterium]